MRLRVRLSVPSTSTTNSISGEGDQVQPMTASKRKLSTFADVVGTPDHDTDNHLKAYMLLSSQFVEKIIKFVCCSSFGTAFDCSLVESVKRGLATRYSLTCTNCTFTLFESYSTPPVSNGRSNDINSRFVYACKMLVSGMSKLVLSLLI